MDKFVLWTDKGYLKGDLHHGVEFTEKENARQFTLDQAQIYKDSIRADLIEFFGVKELKWEYAEISESSVISDLKRKYNVK
nr:hypothetical protein [Paenibacillus xylanexedens]